MNAKTRARDVVEEAQLAREGVHDEHRPEQALRIMAYPRQVFGPGEVLQGMATPDVTTGSGRIDSKISAEVRFAYADAAQAEAVRAPLQGQLDAANRDGMVKILLGETKVDRVENEVVLMVKPNPESTELIAQGVAAAFGTVLGDR
jgi:hypothetical protein